MTPAGARPYANPYLAGVGLGLVLLATFVIMGRGLGASGAFASSAAGVAEAVAPAYAAGHPYFSRYVDSPSGPWLDWLVFEIAGVVAGGYVSARLAGRLRYDVERGEGVSRRARLMAAFCGGSVMGIGAVLARGCTSGQALTGGALLSVGSWAFVGTAFAGGYVMAPLLRRAWR